MPTATTQTMEKFATERIRQISIPLRIYRYQAVFFRHLNFRVNRAFPEILEPINLRKLKEPMWSLELNHIDFDEENVMVTYTLHRMVYRA